MTNPLPLFAPAYLATLWLASGVHHLIRPRELRRSLVEHRLVPRPWAAPLVTAVTVAELALGATALFVVVRGFGRGVAVPALPAITAIVSLASLGMAALFLAYLGLLLRRGPAPASSCGCSPVAAPVTRWSLLPAASVVVVALAALVTGAPAPVFATLGISLLSTGWGVTLAVLVPALPAMVAVPSEPLRSLQEAAP